MKKIIILTIVTLGLGLLINHNIVYANDNIPFYEESQITDPNEDNLNIAKNLKEKELNVHESTFNKIRDFFGLTSYTNQNSPVLAYIKTIVNILLGLVSLISLIIVIVAFYLMFFSKQEEGFNKAKKMLIGVVIALFVMGLSRYIVSYFYQVYTITTTGTP